MSRRGDAKAASEGSATGQPDGGITARSVLLGLVLAAGLAAITPYNDYIINNSKIAGTHFPIGAVAVLLLLSLLNLMNRRLRRRGIMSKRELAVVYTLIMVTSGIPSSGLLRYLLPMCTAGYYFASLGNQWAKLFWDYIPPWLGVSNQEAVNWFWEGTPVGSKMPWGAWSYTLSHWAIYVFAMWLMMTCLAALVRKQWADRERLTFPLMQFPLEVLRDDGGTSGSSFFGNRLVWIGAGAVFAVHIVNGLHLYLPDIPPIPTFWALDNYLYQLGRPWVAAVPLWIGLFFLAIGFAYLLSLEVAAGFWVSVLFMKAQGVVLSAIGYEGGSAYGGVITQISNGEEMGGLLMAAVVLLWFVRRTIADAFRKAFGRAPRVDDSAEPVSYRVTAFGLVIGLAVAFFWLLAAGMTAPYACLFLLVAIGICLVLTRIVAEAGMLMVHLSFKSTDYLLLGGTSALGPANLTALTFADAALTYDLREFLMPSMLNGFYLSERVGVSSRRLTPLLGVALMVVVLVATPAFLLTFYMPGALQAGNVIDILYHPRYLFTLLGTRLQNPETPSAATYLSMGAGAVMVAALMWLRVNFVWWPVHPLGFVMANVWASLNLWFSLFLGWLCKLLTIRYFGLRGYMRLRPLFLGIIMGDVLGGVLWQIVGWFTGLGFTVTRY